MAPAFLDEQVIAQQGAAAGLSADSIERLRAFARSISMDQHHVASAAHHAIYHTDMDFADAVRAADSAFGDDADLLHALITLDSLRIIQERTAAHSIPPASAMASFQRHAGNWMHEAEARGDLASTDWIPSWLRTMARVLYWLGRLEFVLTPFPYRQRVYRHRKTGEVIAMAEAGEPYSDDGVNIGTHTWVATLVETDDAIIGTPFSPRGKALRQMVRLPRDAWDLVLKQGDDVVDVHIPSEGAMTIAALHDAHRQAAKFFDLYYPDRPFAVYACDSWLFSPLLEEILGPDSNIVRWHHEGYLVPDDSVGEDLLELAQTTHDSRLRRALRARLAEGKPLSCGRYLYLRRDLDRFGTQPYREPSARAIARLTVQGL